MSRRLHFLPLLAALPALLCAQEPKLINCRTLESAGNFVGPDEVIVNDMVCQKAKPGATSAPPGQPKPVPGVVIFDPDGSTIVDAAKAASKRVAAAKDAIKEKQNSEEVSPTSPAESSPPAVPASAPAETPAVPAPAPEPAKTPDTVPAAPKQPMSLPAKPARPEVAEAPPPPAVAPAPETAVPSAAGEMSAPANRAPSVAEKTSGTAVAEPPASSANVARPAPASEPRPTPAPAESATTAAAPPEAAAPAQGAPPQSAAPSPETPAASAPEIVLKSAPEPAAAPSAAATEDIAPPAPVVAETPKSSEPARAAESPKASDVPATGGTGFYDANAGTTVVTNPRPEDAVLAQPKPPTPAELAAAAAAKAAAEEAEASLRAPDPNLPRERVVATGAFAEPKEVGPDPASFEHQTNFQPGDSEGFEEGQRADCTKNITIAGLKGEKLVLGTPSWVTRWIEKNEKRLPRTCFSDTPMTTARNYLIVFYTAPTANGNAAPPLDATAAPQGAPAGGVGAFTLSYGSTWHYAQERKVGVTVLTRDEADEPQSEMAKVWYATAYTAEGVPVAEHWPEKTKKPILVDEKDTKSKKAKEARAEIERVADELLDQMVGEIAKL